MRTHLFPDNRPRRSSIRVTTMCTSSGTKARFRHQPSPFSWCPTIRLKRIAGLTLQLRRAARTCSNEDATDRRRRGAITRRESGRVLGSLQLCLAKRRQPGFRVSHGGLTAMVFSNQAALQSAFRSGASKRCQGRPFWSMLRPRRKRRRSLFCWYCVELSGGTPVAFDWTAKAPGKQQS